MTETITHAVTLTDAARDKVRALLLVENESRVEQGEAELRLRLEVKTGGCAGFVYSLFFDEVLDAENDLVRSFDGVEVVVDQMSAPFVDGASIDFEDTIQSQGFKIDNPNAASSCACGDSFS